MWIGGGPGTRKKDASERGLHREGVGDCPREPRSGAPQIGTPELLTGYHEGTGNIEVGITRRCAVDHRAVLPPPGKETVALLQVLLGPPPERVEAPLVLEGQSDEHSIGLPLADSVGTLIASHDATAFNPVGQKRAAERGGVCVWAALRTGKMRRR